MVLVVIIYIIYIYNIIYIYEVNFASPIDGLISFWREE